MTAPSAARPAIAPNPGVFLVPDASAAVVTANSGDVVGKDTTGLAVVFVTAVVSDGEITYRNDVDGLRDPPVPYVLVLETGNDPGDDAGVMTERWQSLITVSSVPDFPPN